MSNRIIPAFALLIAIGIFFLYINPTWSGSIATAKAAIASDNDALVAANQYTAQQNELASARDAISPADLALLTTFLPDSVNNVRIILDLNALAARSGLSLSSINVASSAGASSSGTSSGASPDYRNKSGNFGRYLSERSRHLHMALQNFLQGVERSAVFLMYRTLRSVALDHRRVFLWDDRAPVLATVILPMKSNTILIGAVTLIIAAGAYWYFFTGTGNQQPLTASTSANQAQTQFQTLASELQPISFDTSIFQTRSLWHLLT